MVDHRAKPRGGGEQADPVFSQLELIKRSAALVPTPDTLGHNCHSMLTPNLPLRCAVTAMALAAPAQPAVDQSVTLAGVPALAPPGTVVGGAGRGSMTAPQSW